MCHIIRAVNPFFKGNRSYFLQEMTLKVVGNLSSW